MHSLDESISAWRKAMMATPNISRDAVEEMETHLRETVEQLVRSGMTDRDAFEAAVTQLGPAAAIAAELQKLEPSTWLPIKVILGISSVAAAGAAVLLIARSTEPWIKLLLTAHVLAVTLGYGATFLIGALGICFVCERCFSDFSAMRLRSLPRVTFILGSVAAALTVVAVVLGMVWAKSEWGRYWARDIKEIGALTVILWQLCFLIAHRFARQVARAIPVMSLLGNVIVALAWFGANQLSATTHSYGAPGWPLLLAGVVLNLALFCVGLGPAGWLRLRKAS